MIVLFCVLILQRFNDDVIAVVVPKYGFQCNKFCAVGRCNSFSLQFTLSSLLKKTNFMSFDRHSKKKS